MQSTDGSTWAAVVPSLLPPYYCHLEWMAGYPGGVLFGEQYCDIWHSRG